MLNLLAGSPRLGLIARSPAASKGSHSCSALQVAASGLVVNSMGWVEDLGSHLLLA